jgi:hypothetical protein
MSQKDDGAIVFPLYLLNNLQQLVRRMVRKNMIFRAILNGEVFHDG